MGLKNRVAAVVDEEDGGRDGDVTFYRKRLLEEIDLSEMATLAPTQRRARLERVVGHLVSREGPVLSNRDRAALIRRLDALPGAFGRRFLFGKDSAGADGLLARAQPIRSGGDAPAWRADGLR